MCPALPPDDDPAAEHRRQEQGDYHCKAKPADNTPTNQVYSKGLAYHNWKPFITAAKRKLPFAQTLAKDGLGRSCRRDLG